jgi:hypothetical protein
VVNRDAVGGRLLYLPDADTVLTTGTAALVLLTWIAGTGIAAAVRLLAHDA